jgi:hypothetical protein
MSGSGKTGTIRKALLVCGILSSLLCIGTDIVAAMSWQGYSYIDQAVSELTAIGSPTRPFVIPLLITCEVLVIAFGMGVLIWAGKKRSLRIAGIILAIYGVVSLMSFFFPMNLRGVAERSFTDAMHLIFGGVAVLLILLFIGFGAAARGKGFRIYSIGTILTILVFGALAGMQAPRIDMGPTPWLGIIERVSYYSPMVWMLVFAIVLLRSRVRR